MHRFLIPGIALLLLLSACQEGPQETNPYSEHKNRTIKALSQEEIAGYLEGDGMGFALAAELNRFPGPKHALNLKRELDLTERQAEEISSVFEEMNSRARILGRQIVNGEERLDAYFSGRKTPADSVQSLILEIAALKGALRWTHLRAHLQMKELLTPSQVDAYEKHRGYRKNGGDQHRHDL